MASLFNFYFRKLLPSIGGIISDKKAYTYLPESVKNFEKFQRIKIMLKKNNLNIFQQKKFLWGRVDLYLVKKYAQHETKTKYYSLD